MRKVVYREGTVFLVPLRSGDFARGLVARASKRGKIIFGCFWGPRITKQSDVSFDDLLPSTCVLKCRFGDLGLINRSWPILGQIPNWERDSWPMPEFESRNVEAGGKKLISKYDDRDPGKKLECYLGKGAVTNLPDVMYGFGALEIKLSTIIKDTLVI